MDISVGRFLDEGLNWEGPNLLWASGPGFCEKASRASRWNKSVFLHDFYLYLEFLPALCSVMGHGREM